MFAKNKQGLAESREQMLDLYLVNLLRQPERVSLITPTAGYTLITKLYSMCIAFELMKDVESLTMVPYSRS